MNNNSDFLRGIRGGEIEDDNEFFHTGFEMRILMPNFHNCATEKEKDKKVQLCIYTYEVL